MPRVPVYDSPQVNVAPLRTPQAEAPTGFDIAARQNVALGNALQDAAQPFDRMALQDANREAFEVEANVKKAWLDYSSQLQQQRQGSSAKGVTAEVEKWWADQAPKLTESAKNPLAQRMLKNALSKLQLAGMEQFQGFENRQLEVAADAAFEANVKSTISLAAADPGERNLALQRTAVQAAVRQQAQAKGWAPEVLNDKMATAQSALTVAAFNTLLQRNPMQARDFYNANRELVRGEQRDEIEGRLKSAVAAAEGGNAAREVFGALMAGKGLNDAVPTDKIDAELVKRFEGNPDTLRAARAEMDRQVALRNQAQSESNAAAINDVYGLLNRNTPLAQVQRTPQWAALTEKAKRGIEQEIADRNHMLWARSVEDRARVERERELRHAPTMLLYSQPENLARMTRAGIINLMPEIGAANTEKLLQRWQTWQTDQTKLSQAKLDNDMFNSAMAAAGFDPKPKSSDKEGNKKVMDLRTAVELRLGQDQQRTGREMTAMEKQKVIQDVVNAQVLRERTLMTDAKVNPFTAPADEMADTTRLYVEVPNGQMRAGKPVTQRVRMSDIPPAEYADTERFLRERGRPATPAAVAEAWLRAKGNTR